MTLDRITQPAHITSYTPDHTCGIRIDGDKHRVIGWAIETTGHYDHNPYTADAEYDTTKLVPVYLKDGKAQTPFTNDYEVIYLNN